MTTQDHADELLTYLHLLTQTEAAYVDLLSRWSALTMAEAPPDPATLRAVSRQVRLLRIQIQELQVQLVDLEGDITS
ncbi:MAG: hypothetical protein OEZ39_16615 [Gammaproteobacteria bacterium]|nr:hypothetical protein [Gammaproteobacteria bacterium]MDH5653484.1 hypothetical protein [Gammaproteobacteria bacterium]